MLTGSSCRRGGTVSSRSCSTRPSRRSTSRMMMSVQRTSSGSSSAPRKSCAAPLMPPSGFLISCASPSATLPSVASRSAPRPGATQLLGGGVQIPDRPRGVDDNAPVLEAREPVCRVGRGGAGRGGSRFGARAQLEVVLAARRTAITTVVGVLPAAALHLVDHLVELVTRVLAELLAHLSHPAGHALRVLLVDVAKRGRIGKVVQPGVFRTYQGEARHEPRELPAPAPLALRLDLFAHPKRQHRRLPPAVAAAVLVDRHEDADYNAWRTLHRPGGTGWSRPRLRRG